MDKEKLNENVSDIEEKSVEIDEAKTNEEMKIEDTVDTEKEDVSKKKKVKKERSNGFKMLRILVCIVLAISVFLIATGAWNPFMNREPEKQAVENYENSLEASRELSLELGYGEYDYELGEDQVIPREYAPDGEFPYGFEILEDNGKEGKNGVLKAMTTADSGYTVKFGLSFEVYYMKNKDYAKEQYIAKKGANCFGQTTGEFAKEYDIPTGKVAFSYKPANAGLITIVVRDNTTVYDFYGDIKNYNKMQALFDVLKIDFKLPALEELK